MLEEVEVPPRLHGGVVHRTVGLGAVRAREADDDGIDFRLIPRPDKPDKTRSFVGFVGLQISARLFCHTCPFYGVSVKIIVGHLSPTRGGYLEGWIKWQAP